MWLPAGLLSRTFYLSIPPLFLLLCFGSLSAQSTVAGEWEGEILLPGTSLDLTITLEERGGEWSGTYSIPVQGVNDFPLEDIGIDPPDISFGLGGGIPGKPSFSLKLSEDGASLEGSFMQGGQTFGARFSRESADEAAAVQKSLEERVGEIRTLLEKVREDFNIPGMSVAIVKGDSLLLAEGFGERNLAEHLPVTPSTLFAIGSTTKAFTSVVIGSLADEGKLEWDDRVIDHLPDFRLHDEYATLHMTVRDLLTHVSGLPRHDLMWYGSDFSREDLFARLRHLEPTADLRGKWQYQNLMFMTAGLLAERVSGMSWEELVRERIFKPLGMENANFSVDRMQESSDYSIPYAEVKEKSEKIDFRNISAIGPAGSINAGADEMAAWLQMNLNGGEYGGKRVISAENLAVIHSPQVVIPGGGGVRGLLFNLYGMGWMLNAYRGHRLIHHGGGIDGFVSHVALLPDDDIGMVILTNQPSGLPQLAVFDIADRLLGLEPYDHLATVAAMQEATAGEEEEEEADDPIRVKGTKPTWNPEEYAGEYEHPAYGRIRIKVEGKRLLASFHGEELPLVHYHYDVFRASAAEEDDAESGAGFLVSFQPDPSGGIDGLEVPLEPTLDPLGFEKLPSAQLRDPAYLQRFAGTYNLQTQKAVVDVRDSTLSVTLPGQPRYRLEPVREVAGTFAEFDLAGMSGFRVRFEQEGETIVRLLFLQPNGTFAAEREK